MQFLEDIVKMHLDCALADEESGGDLLVFKALGYHLHDADFPWSDERFNLARCNFPPQNLFEVQCG